MRVLPLLLLLAPWALQARAEPARSAEEEAWPLIIFDLELIDVLNGHDTIQWSASPIDASDATRERLAELIRHELASRYDTHFLREDLVAVHVVRDLSGGGHRWGGLHWGRHVLLTSGPDRYVVGALHHEITGLLLKRHADTFPWDEWRSGESLPPRATGDFSYLPREGSRTGRGASRLVELTERLARRGHVSSYGVTSDANDVEEYVRLTCLEPGRVLRLARDHAPVRRKLLIALEFLRSISGGRMDAAFHRGWMVRSGDSLLARDPSLLALLEAD